MAGTSTGKSRAVAGLSETVRGQKTPQKQRRQRKLVCVVERRRAYARVLSATTHSVACRPRRRFAAFGNGGSRSNGSVQRRSAPPAFFREEEIEKATHPGRKTGRMGRGCLTLGAATIPPSS
jgi:hypothetical protein